QLVQPLAGAGRQLEQRALGVDAPVVGGDTVQVECKIGQHVALGQGQAVGVGEHEGVFGDLVVPLRDAQHRQAEVFADVELGGADEVADVFHKQHVQPVQVELGQDVLDAHGFDVAGAVGVQLDGGDVQGSDLFGVDLAGDVPLDDADGKFFPQPGDQRGQQGGLARAGAAHHVDEAHFVPAQGVAHLGAHVLVPLHDR